MINLFQRFDTVINTSKFSHHLHDECVTELEETLCNFVGGKFACALSSATVAIELVGKYYAASDQRFLIPAVIPPVVVNALLESGAKFNLEDDGSWVGSSYIMSDVGIRGVHNTIIDSAQRIENKQIANFVNYIAIFSFYPTKPLGGMDGGLVVSDNKLLIDWLRKASRNGTSPSNNSWDREVHFPGWKVYMNSFQARFILDRFVTYERQLEKVKEIRDFYNKEFERSNKSDHIYTLMVEDGDLVRKLMLEKGVVCGKHYTPVYKFKPYANLKPAFAQASELIDKHTITIPMHADMSLKDAEYIEKIIRDYIV